MMFDPEDWLIVAEICCSNIPGVSREALLRTALNRAYFGALMAVKVRIELAHGFGAVPGWRTHDSIKQAVRTGGPAFEQISRTMEDLRRLREKADYVLDSGEWDWSTVHDAVAMARWVIRNRIKALSDAEFRRLYVPHG